MEEWCEPRLVLAGYVQQRLDLGAAPGINRAHLGSHAAASFPQDLSETSRRVSGDSTIPLKKRRNSPEHTEHVFDRLEAEFGIDLCLNKSQKIGLRDSSEVARPKVWNQVGFDESRRIDLICLFP